MYRTLSEIENLIHKSSLKMTSPHPDGRSAYGTIVGQKKAASTIVTGAAFFIATWDYEPARLRSRTVNIRETKDEFSIFFNPLTMVQVNTGSSATSTR